MRTEKSFKGKQMSSTGRTAAMARFGLAAGMMCAAAMAPCAALAAMVVDSMELDGTDVAFAEDAVVSNMHVSAETKVTLNAGVTLDVLRYANDGIVLCRFVGGGTVRIADVSGENVRFEVNNSTTLRFVEPTAGTDTHSLAAGAVLHLDAMEAGSLEVEKRGCTNYVAKWRDVRGEGHMHAANSSESTQPFLVQGARPWVDMGKYVTSGATGRFLTWSERREDVREVFMVVSDTEDARKSSGVKPFLLTDDASHDFHRGYGDCALFSTISGYPSPNVTNGVITLDRAAVGPFEPLPEGFHLVHIRTTGPVKAGSFAKERNLRSGGQRLQEVIVFDSLLDDETQAALEARLYAKWLRRVQIVSLHGSARVESDVPIAVDQFYTSPNDDNVIAGDFDAVYLETSGRITVEAGSVTAADHINAGCMTGNVRCRGESRIYSLGGVDAFAKTDGGEAKMYALSATNISVEAGSLTVEMRSPALDSFFHVDASALWNGTLVTSGSTNGMPLVTQWRCVRGQSRRYAAAEDGGAKPFVRANFLNGLPVVDFGSPKYVGKGWHGFDYGHGGYLTWNSRLATIREVFWVFSDTEDWAAQTRSSTPGTFLLGDTNAGKTYDFHRGYSTTTCPYFHSSNTKDCVRNGTLRCDGEVVSAPISTAIPPGFHVIHLRTKDGSPATAGNFANDRGYIMGGQRLAEVLVYTNQTGEAEFAAVEAYLRNKWFNAGAPGGEYGTVSVAEGASVALPRNASAAAVVGPGTVVARGGLTAVKVSGGASFSGDLTLADGAEVTISDLSAMSVSGTLRLPERGTLVLVGEMPDGPLQGRSATAIEAGALAGASTLAGWHVDTSRLSRDCRARAKIVGTSVEVSFFGGTLVIVR